MSSQDSEQTLRRIMEERRGKAEALRQAGQHPYRNDFQPTHACAALRGRYQGTQRAAEGAAEPGPGIQPVDGEVVRVAGRLMARRGFGKTVFAPLRDASGDLQLFLNVEHLDPGDFEQVLPLVDVGDIVGAEGVIFWTRRGELSLLCRRLFLLTKSLRPLPDKWHGLTDVETRYRQRYLDLAVNPEVREVFARRSRIIQGIRRFLDDRGFLEVETPMMHPIIGGAAARPFVTRHNALGMELYMRIAPELYLKRLLVGGFERVYEINRNFRNEGLSRQHNPEFTMLEFYQAYATYEHLMDLTEELIGGLADQVNGGRKCTWDGVEIDLAGPWKRLSVRQAVAELGGQPGEIFDDPVRAARCALEVGVDRGQIAAALLEGLEAEQVNELGKGLDSAGTSLGGDRDAPFLVGVARAGGFTPDWFERAAGMLPEAERRVRAGHLGYLVFEATAEAKLVQPTFLHDFPLAVSPLARKKPGDPALCDRFELFIGGREIANAFSELNDPDDQRQRFLAQLKARERGADETMDYDEDYCRALELGMPPAAGEGIGIDRLTMLLTGQSSIRDVLLFPLMRPE
jgi:lysyl-tRNA synthetase class 2